MTYEKVAGRYALRHEIGRGGAGAVWLAVDEVLGREVALKRIGLPPGAEDVDVARAEREARLAAQVTDPHVVAVFDFVAGRNEHWLVMEHVAGTDLARMVRERGPLPAGEAADILAAATHGLAAAHRLGIVHRDVKPSNILVGTDGSVKLSDFGIARGVSDATLTQTGLVTGSPAYLAPEVATGGSATMASDIWSLGASLFHAVAGAPPYQGGEANPIATLYRIAHEPRPEVTTEPWAAALIDATMTHDPQRRPTADQVQARLRDREAVDTTTRALPDAPTAVAPPVPAASGRTRDRRPLWAGAAVVMLLLVVVGGLALAGSRDEPAPTTADGTGAPTEPSSPAPTEDNTERAQEDSRQDSGTRTVTAADLEDFARKYVATASSDPDAGFSMLTEGYQARSPQYEEFWGSVTNPRFVEVSGDPDAMQVSYTYEYSYPGKGRITEAVQLQLVRDGGDLLISGAGQP